MISEGDGLIHFDSRSPSPVVGVQDVEAFKHVITSSTKVTVLERAEAKGTGLRTLAQLFALPGMHWVNCQIRSK